VAIPTVVIVDRPGEVRYLYSGKDLADRPEDEGLFATLDGLESGIVRLTGGPELQVGAARASESRANPARRAMELEQLIPYFRSVSSTTTLLMERLARSDRSGNQTIEVLESFQRLVHRYMKALEETAEQKT
jgi:hypothetical protein